MLKDYPDLYKMSKTLRGKLSLLSAACMLTVAKPGTKDDYEFLLKAMDSTDNKTRDFVISWALGSFIKDFKTITPNEFISKLKKVPASPATKRTLLPEAFTYRILQKSLLDSDPDIRLKSLLAVSNGVYDFRKLKSEFKKMIMTETDPLLLFYYFAAAKWTGAKKSDFPDIINLFYKNDYIYRVDAIDAILAGSLLEFDSARLLPLLIKYCKVSNKDSLDVFRFLYRGSIDITIEILSKIKPKSLSPIDEKILVDFFYWLPKIKTIQDLVKLNIFQLSSLLKLVSSLWLSYRWGVDPAEDHLQLIVNIIKSIGFKKTFENLSQLPVDFFHGPGHKIDYSKISGMPEIDGNFILNNWNKSGYNQLVFISLFARYIKSKQDEIILKLLDFPLPVVRASLVFNLNGMPLSKQVKRKILQLYKNDKEYHIKEAAAILLNLPLPKEDYQ